MCENTVFVKRYGCTYEINEEEIWRYAGYRGVPHEQDALRGLLREVIEELKDGFTYKVCYRRLKELPFGEDSRDLQKCLRGCDEIILFAATVGLGLDRYIARHQRNATTKALLAQACGTERIESLCDLFCWEMQEEAAREGKSCTARFSPGYGDLPIQAQKDIFALLDCGRQIGVSLSDSLLMTPSKSVTAVFGVRAGESCQRDNKCGGCKNSDCIYRR